MTPCMWKGFKAHPIDGEQGWHINFVATKLGKFSASLWWGHLDFSSCQPFDRKSIMWRPNFLRFRRIRSNLRSSSPTSFRQSNFLDT